MSAKYTLHYFDAKGRAELIRWAFKVAKVEFEDKRYSKEEWEEFKPKTPFEQLPVLEFEDGEMLCQTSTITFYVASECGLTGSSKREAAQIGSINHCMEDTCKPLADAFFGATEEIKKAAKEKFATVTMPKFLKFLTTKLKDGKQYLVGDKLSLADLAVARLVTDLPPEAKNLVAQFAEVQALVDRVLALPEIKDWLEQRPKTEF